MIVRLRKIRVLNLIRSYSKSPTRAATLLAHMQGILGMASVLTDRRDAALARDLADPSFGMPTGNDEVGGSTRVWY